jgi:hypothetical protein
VVFRSCKLIPTMIISSVLNKRSFSFSEYAAALAVCFGLILFANADSSVSPQFNPWGILLVRAMMMMMMMMVMMMMMMMMIIIIIIIVSGPGGAHKDDVILRG